MKFTKWMAIFLLTVTIFMTILPIVCYARAIIIEIENRDGVYIGECFHCGSTCEYVIGHEWWTKKIHCIRHWCSNCGYDQNMWTNAEPHLTIGEECYWCGYPKHKKDAEKNIYHEKCND